MNTKVLVSGACVAGVAVAAVGVLKKTEAHAAYLNEIENLNSIPLTSHGMRDASAVRAAQIHDSMDPEKAKKLLNEKMLASQAKGYDEKVEHYRKCLEIDPDDIDSMDLLAANLAYAGKKEEARKYYEKIISESKIEIKVRIAKRALFLLDQNK
jgi:tetratricopeptide (TPR) repeat protein